MKRDMLTALTVEKCAHMLNLNIPDYIQIAGAYAHISDFDDDALERLGALWTRALIARATELRKGKPKHARP